MTILSPAFVFVVKILWHRWMGIVIFYFALVLFRVGVRIAILSLFVFAHSGCYLFKYTSPKIKTPPSGG